MDDQRVQAYVGLIEQLLGYPQGQERDLLQANAELMDAGLLGAMEQYAAYLESQGNSNAGWLRDFSRALVFRIAAQKETDDTARFFLEILKLIEESNGNPQQVYPAWAQQQTRLNLELLAIIPAVGAQLLAGDAEQRNFVAVVLVRFGNLVNQFLLGTRWLNLELGIAAYQQALTVITQDTMPVDWATILMNLANTYSSRIRGDRAENIEQAIAAYQQALTVMTQDAMPVDWAMTLNNLALAYFSRIRGDRAENLEQAIAAYQQALTVRTQDTMPVEWATTLNNLANSYSSRIRGDQVENLEQAITAYQQALTVRTQDAMPVEWAQTLMNLATTYKDSIRGDRAENIEQAIVAYQQAMTVMTQDAMPMEWAQTLMNLANVYSDRIRGDRSENLEQAIGCFTLVLEVYTRVAFPYEWALTQNNLAVAYTNRIRGDRTENLKQAIEAYELALQVYTHAAFPDNCRRTSRNLGNRHFEQRNWRSALDAYTTALTAAETLEQSCILLDGKAAELAETADLPRRLAYALAQTGNLKKAVETLEQGRARGLSESLDRDRANLNQLQQLTPDLYNQSRDLTEQLRTLESQQRDRMTSTDRHSLTPEVLRETAIDLRQQLNQLIPKIRQIPGYESFLTLPTFEEIRQAAKRDKPLVYLVTPPAGSIEIGRAHV